MLYTPNLGAGGSDNVQFRMRSSSHIVIWCPMVRHSVSVGRCSRKPEVLFKKIITCRGRHRFALKAERPTSYKLHTASLPTMHTLSVDLQNHKAQVVETAVTRARIAVVPSLALACIRNWQHYGLETPELKN